MQVLWVLCSGGIYSAKSPNRPEAKGRDEQVAEVVMGWLRYVTCVWEKEKKRAISSRNQP